MASLKNATVSEIIEALKEMPQDAIFCLAKPENEWLVFYTTPQLIKLEGEKQYVDDIGDEVTKLIVSIQ